jgi:hypothetical protein
MNSDTIPKALIRQKKECRQDHKVDGTDKHYHQVIQEHVLFEENFYIDDKANAHNQLNYQLPNCDGRNNSIIPKFVVKLMVQYSYSL